MDFIPGMRRYQSIPETLNTPYLSLEEGALFFIRPNGIYRKDLHSLYIIRV